MPTPAAFLQAKIGSATVLARPHGRRLWLLDESNAVLWDLYQAGADRTLVVSALSEHFGLTTEAATDHVRQLEAAWRDAGLIASSEPPVAEPPCDPLPVFPTAGDTPTMSAGFRLTVADHAIVLEVRDADLRADLERLLSSLRGSAQPDNGVADLVTLSGDATSWRLSVNDADIDAGAGRDNAVVATLSVLTELGSRTGERMLVVHGAGLISPAGRCVLLVAPGGSGKSTLAVALVANGFRLLSDDVVPVRPDGAALGLGLPACLKRGSWEIVAAIHPDFRQGLDVERFGQTVRLLPAAGGGPAAPITPSFLLFPEYRRGASPARVQLAPDQALQRLVEAESIIRDLTQEKLEALCRWVGGTPAYVLTFPDVSAGVALLCEIIGEPTPDAA